MKFAIVFTIIALALAAFSQAAILSSSTLTVNPVSFTTNDTAVLRLTIFSGGSSANFTATVTQAEPITSFANTTISGTTTGTGPIYSYTTNWTISPTTAGTYNFNANVTDTSTNTSTTLLANGTISGTAQTSSISLGASAPSVASAGTPFTLTANTTNNGTTNQTGVNVTISATNATISPSISSFDITAGQSNISTFNITISNPGVYTILVSSQNPTILATKSVPITITNYPLIPDLGVAINSASPLTEGSPTSIVVNVTNNGPSEKNASLMLFIDGTNTQNSTLTVSSATTTQATFTNSFGSGTHTINLTVQNITDETYLANNNANLTVSVSSQPTQTTTSGSSGSGGGGGGSLPIPAAKPTNATPAKQNITTPIAPAAPNQTINETESKETSSQPVVPVSAPQETNKTQPSAVTGNIVANLTEQATKPQVLIPLALALIGIAGFALYQFSKGGKGGEEMQQGAS